VPLPLGNHLREIFQGVYKIREGDREKLATVNLSPGNTVYGEETVKIHRTEYRFWDPYRSKLAAAILRGLTTLPIHSASRILYLGAASGTTVSHLSDIIGNTGRIYAVEFAQRSFRDLVSNVCINRTNITPILADARFPQKYRSIVSLIECVYCDIAQPDQTRIFIDNAEMFLEAEGDFLHVVKARSINVAKDPSQIVQDEANRISQEKFHLKELIRLAPFELDHAMIRGEKKL
jgi:fibrillarin-like pre-rRNA processing protein